jgi:alkylhydroperoxidase family enzyme
MIQSLPFRFLLPLAFLMLVGIAADATARSLDKILKQAVKALGGESALRRITTREAKGTIRRASDGAQGSLQMLTLKPDLYLLTFDVGGLEASLLDLIKMRASQINGCAFCIEKKSLSFTRCSSTSSLMAGVSSARCRSS